MNLSDLKKRVAAARRIDVEPVPGKVLSIQRPSQFDLQIAAARAGVSAGSPGSQVQWERLIVVGAVIDWQGIVASDFGVDGDDACSPVAYDADAVQLLLDEQPDWYKLAAERLWAEITKAEKAQGDAEKN